jgi:hypothetical protein
MAEVYRKLVRPVSRGEVTTTQKPEKQYRQSSRIYASSGMKRVNDPH